MSTNEQASDGATGTPAPVRGGAPASAPGARVASHRADVRAALLAGDGDAPEAKPEPKPAAVEAKPAPVAEPDEAADDDAEDAPAPKAAAEDKPDAETSKRLARVQAEEKRSRDRLAKEREEVTAMRAAAAKEREELTAVREKLGAFEKAQERARLDPVAYLRAAGVAEAELEDAARQVYAAAKGNPANKAEAARLMREKELAAEIAELKKWREERTTSERERTETEQATRAAAEYMTGVSAAAAAGEVSPLAKHFLATHPEKTDRRLRQIAVELLTETGDTPDAADVLARYEKTRREELDELGIDPTTFLTAKPAKKPDQLADKKPPAKTLNNDLSTQRVPKSKSSDRDVRAATLRAIESGQLDS